MHIDHLYDSTRQDWYVWAHEQITTADFTLIIASPACCVVGDGQMPAKLHRGLQSEMGILRELLHTDRAQWTKRLLPVVLPGGTPDEIPLFLQPRTVDHYPVHAFTKAGAADLLAALRHDPRVQGVAA
ncbi:hypothetical protein UO65_0621 [Actinokineospora spheciospongiae]|uniref:SEFIR domain-containing protein n=1 Tax=Actinokineospora spheciospongiae TaxID=909613 RepID=W7JDM5_9PSEU|nr:hypothetical protein UO65_0621 [Actinokineospora spheciospongiae]